MGLDLSAAWDNVGLSDALASTDRWNVGAIVSS
jgi:hypothetical protein